MRRSPIRLKKRGLIPAFFFVHVLRYGYAMPVPNKEVPGAQAGHISPRAMAAVRDFVRVETKVPFPIHAVLARLNIKSAIAATPCGRLW